MGSVRSEKVDRPMKHYVVRCEWVGGEGEGWRFMLIDPQSAEKTYFKNLEGLQKKLLQQLEKLSKDLKRV